MARTAEVVRNTKETQITVSVDLDGTGVSDVETGVGFFDHMLDSFARHGGIDLKVRTKGDLHIDAHHTVEDTGIVLLVGDRVGSETAVDFDPETRVVGIDLDVAGAGAHRLRVAARADGLVSNWVEVDVVDGQPAG